jgi:predicted nucleotidyltransferase
MKKINPIAGLRDEEIDRLMTLFAAEPLIAEVVLYGSRAKGSHRDGSDIDLTLKGGEMTTKWLLGLSSKIDDLLLPYEMDLSIFDYIENPDLIDHIHRVGKVVFCHE